MSPRLPSSPLLVVGFLLASALGCGGRPTGDAIGVPRIEPPERSGLVWLVVAPGQYRTLWVSLDDGSPLTSQSIEGAIIAVGDRLWRWEPRARTVPLYDAADLEVPEGGGAPEPSREGTVYAGVIRDLADAGDSSRPSESDDERTILAPPDPGVVREVVHEVSLDGAVGPHLFVVSSLYLDAFGAHGHREVSGHVVNLATLDERPLEPTAPAFEAAVSEARARFGEPAEVVALHPRWNQDGTLTMGARLAHEVCYACSDGEWSDYTESIVVPVPTPPPPFGEATTLPAWARNAAATMPGAAVGGFSVVEGMRAANALEALRR